MQFRRNLSCDVLNISYNDFIPKTSLRDLILSQRLNPKTRRRANAFEAQEMDRSLFSFSLLSFLLAPLLNAVNSVPSLSRMFSDTLSGFDSILIFQLNYIVSKTIN